MLITDKDEQRLAYLKRYAEQLESDLTLFGEENKEDRDYINNEIAKLEVKLGISKLDNIMDEPVKQIDNMFNSLVHKEIERIDNERWSIKEVEGTSRL